MSSFSHLSRMSELSALGSPDGLEDVDSTCSPSGGPSQGRKASASSRGSRGGNVASGPRRSSISTTTPPTAIGTSHLPSLYSRQTPPTSADVVQSALLQVSIGERIDRRSVKLRPDDLVTGQRVLMKQNDGLYVPGKLVALRPPDVYGILLDGERGNKPHILSYEQVLELVILEVTPRTKNCLPRSSKVCAYYSHKFRTLHPGIVSNAGSTNKTPTNTVKIDFEDGDEAIVALEDIRIISALFIASDYTLLSASCSPNGSIGDGSVSSSSQPTNSSSHFNRKHKRHLWQLDQTSLKPITGNPAFAKKMAFSSIIKNGQRISVNDCVSFHSCTDSSSNKLPFIGQVLGFFKRGTSDVTAPAYVKVSWFYHPSEMKLKTISDIKNTLYRTTHVDENDIQTISHKVCVLELAELAPFHYDHASAAKHHSYNQGDLYVCAGTYDPSKGTLVTS